MKVIAESERIFLRETTPEDAEVFYLLNLNPDVVRYTGDIPFQNIEEARSFLFAYDQFRRYKMGRWAIVKKENGHIIGWCGLKYHPIEDFVDLGFRLFQGQWNKGYATEAAILSMNYGFQKLDLDRIVGRADLRNAASIRVLEKIGMKKVGFEKEDGVDMVVMEVRKIGDSRD